jgi:ankyrin repeat protein
MYGGHIDIVRILLDRGADVDMVRTDHRTALHYTSFFDFFDIVKALLDQGATVNKRNDDGRMAFQIAAMCGHRTIMRLLSEYGTHRMPVVDC